MTNEDQEYVNVELIFDKEKNDSEIIKLPKNAFLNIQQNALADNVSFEEKFLELLEREISEYEN